MQGLYRVPDLPGGEFYNQKIGKPSSLFVPSFPLPEYGKCADAHIAALHRFISEGCQDMRYSSTGGGFSLCPGYPDDFYLFTPRRREEPGKVVFDHHPGIGKHRMIWWDGGILDNDVRPEEIFTPMCSRYA